MKRFTIVAALAAVLAVPVGASAETTTISADACTTPVFPCVQQTIDGAFNTVDGAVATARNLAYQGVDAIDDPPPIQNICYTIWGQPCAAALL